MTDREMLFLAGVARSGTTAMRRVLGTHPEIAVGMERFKRLWGDQISSITPACFERERFFDFTDGHTNITPDVGWAAERLAALEDKWDTARYHGDKMTVIRAQRLWQTFPEARFVFIVRDLAQVASSWQRRAADAEDATWRSGADARSSVAAWNTAVGRIARAVSERPDHALVVDYTRFFADPDAASLHAIMDFLGLDVEPVREVWHEAHLTYVERVAGRDRTLPTEIAAFVAEHRDHAAWERVTALAR